MGFKFLTKEEEKKLTPEELKAYYMEMRDYYKDKNFLLNDTVYSFFHNMYGFCSKYIRNYKLEIRGLKNIDENDNYIFACNHSNANDTYTMHESFKKFFRPLAGSDCLNRLNYSLIALAGGVFIDRSDKESAREGTNHLIENILAGYNVVIFPEGTWCLHPSKVLLPFHVGVADIAAKTGKKIIPVIFDYHEVDKLCTKPSQLFDKCIVQIGEPIEVKETENVFLKVSELRDTMATMRWLIWEEYGYFSREDIDPMIYENHTQLKVNSLLFKYDEKEEEKYIYHDDDYIYQKDSYHIDYPMNRVHYPENRVLLKKKN